MSVEGPERVTGGCRCGSVRAELRRHQLVDDRGDSARLSAVRTAGGVNGARSLVPVPHAQNETTTTKVLGPRDQSRAILFARGPRADRASKPTSTRRAPHVYLARPWRRRPVRRPSMEVAGANSYYSGSYDNAKSADPQRESSGEGGIRTRGRLLTDARLASGYLRPLGHLSRVGEEGSTAPFSGAQHRRSPGPP